MKCEDEGIRGISSRDIDKGPDDNPFGRRREFDRKVLDFSNSSDSGRIDDSLVVVLSSGRDIEIGPHDLVVLLGTFWIAPRESSRRHFVK